MWWQRAPDWKHLLDASWLQAPLQDPDTLVHIRRDDHTLVFVSDNAHALLGHAPEALVGQPLWNLFLPADMHDLAPIMEASRERLGNSLVRMRSKDDVQWFRTVCLPVEGHIITIQQAVPAPTLAKCRPLQRDEDLSLGDALATLTA